MSKEGAGVIDTVRRARLVPVVVLETEDQAIPLANALMSGGLPVAEVTFRTDAAAGSIARIAREFPDMLVGAGTVLTVDQVARAHDAGAQFLVSPGFNPKVVQSAQDRDLPIIAGTNNPTTVEAAIEAGLNLLKFFPAEASGGIPMLKALGGPYGDVTFVPTGGIGPKNVNAYLALPNVLACGGSWMVDPKLVAAGDFNEIQKRTEDAVALTATEQK